MIMSDKELEIVIKIPKKWSQNMVREKFAEVDELCAVIQHGTILPENHGRIVDANTVIQKWKNVKKS